MRPEDALILEGNRREDGGDLAGACELYREAIRLAPSSPRGHLNLGIALAAMGESDPAARAYEAVLALDPHHAFGHYNYALLAAQRGDLAFARTLVERALDAKPDLVPARILLANICTDTRDPDGALAQLDAALALAPDHAGAHYNRTTLLAQLGREERAVDSARQWAAIAPGEWSAPFIEGQSLHALGRHDEALVALARAESLAGGNAAVAHTRGNVLFAMGRIDEAERAYADACAAAPDWIEPRLNRGVALDGLGRHEEALRCFDAVLAREPRHRLALYWRPVTLIGLRRVNEALEAVTQSRELYPGDADVEWHYAFTHLLAGRMREGWRAYESRWKSAAVAASLAPLPFREPLWTGQPLQGKTLLLYPEQGLGDMLQFIRFVPRLERMGARVLVWAPESLVELAGTVSPRVQVACRLEDLPAFDLRCPIMSVPLALGVTLDELPGPVPYVHPDRKLADEWSARLGAKQGLRVGVVWSGNPAQPNDRNRSIPLATFARIDAPGCEFIALQNAVRDVDRPALESWKALRFFGDELRTFADTAALASQMDLIVSVCTSGAHLAGALGLRLWVLLGYRADWRWLLDREDSPWYPSARLFRQNAARNWDEVIARVRAALTSRAST